MNFRTLKKIAEDQPGKKVVVNLPSKEQLPHHFHFTEIGVVTKNFFDCGGRYRSSRHISLQTWVAEDEDHRMTTDKLTKILGNYADEIMVHPLEVLVEVQGDTVGVYGIASVDYGNDDLSPVAINLGRTETACLAEDVCGVKAATGRSCGPRGCC